MGKEIEYKWLWKEGRPFTEIVEGNYECVTIKDYYFNPLCRLRDMHGFWYITIKSEPNLIRDEYEFEVNKELDLDFLPNPMLIKDRFYVPVGEYEYEVNVFRNIVINDKPLVTVELEVPSVHAVFDKADFCGADITFNDMFYGYNLWSYVKRLYDSNMKSGHKCQIIKFPKNT